MSGKSIEIKEKERGEEKARLVERSCNFDSISIISKESEHLSVPKRNRVKELEKSERVKENEYFEKQESEKKRKEKKR